MRTTLDLDDVLVVRAKAEAARQRTTLTRLIEGALARELDALHEATEPSESYRVRVFGDPNAPKMSYDEYKARGAEAELEYDLRQAGLLPFRDPDNPADRER